MHRSILEYLRDFFLFFSAQFLSEGDQQARQQQEIATLEQTLTFQEKMHHRNVNDRKETIKNIKRLIRRKEKDNEQLDADLEELALSVAERRNVNEANGKQNVFTEQGIVFRVLSLRQRSHVHYLAS